MTGMEAPRPTFLSLHRLYLLQNGNEMNTIAIDALKYVAFLTAQGLLTDEHALTVSLLIALVDKLDECTNPTQFANVTKEIRATMDALPRPEVKQTDEIADFFTELEDLA
jgi:hypothetical protein